MKKHTSGWGEEENFLLIRERCALSGERIEKEKEILGDESSCRSRMRLTKQDFVIDKTDTGTGSVGRR